MAYPLPAVPPRVLANRLSQQLDGAAGNARRLPIWAKLA